MTLSDYYLPGYKGGGLVRTISNIVDWLGGEFDFRIITRDRDLGNDHAYPNIQYDSWMPVGKAQVRYMPPDAWKLSTLSNLLNQINYDALYLNSFFSVLSVKIMFLHWGKRRPEKPSIRAPRNEFYPGTVVLKR